jgi:NAD(P)-dependent dehydrogenase (short-subunit alcohol dehydrogenase family)
MKVWLITGCASGFGRALAEMALARGDKVAASDRSIDTVRDLASQYPDSALALGIDVTKPAEVKAGVDAAFAHFGRVDVLVNNAGYGVQAAVEEVDMAQVRAMFEVNLFGMIEVLRAALPHLRAQGSGHIMNFASVGGRVAGPLMALYSASKFAVEGLSEGLAAEVADFGIKVTVIEPGAFATKFGVSAVMPSNPMEAYEPIRSKMAEVIKGLAQGIAGDLAGAMLELADSPNPPRQFIGGSDAYAMIEGSLKAQQEEMEAWRDLSTRANTAAIGRKADFGL